MLILYNPNTFQLARKGTFYFIQFGTFQMPNDPGGQTADLRDAKEKKLMFRAPSMLDAFLSKYYFINKSMRQLSFKQLNEEESWDPNINLSNCKGCDE